MIPVYDEDQLAKLLSDLPPMDYEQLMKKVKRSKWSVMGLKGGYVHKEKKYKSK